jgi:putative DNA primase/helicase
MDMSNATTQAGAQAVAANILKFGSPTATDACFRPFEEWAWSQRHRARFERRKLRRFPRPYEGELDDEQWSNLCDQWFPHPDAGELDAEQWAFLVEAAARHDANIFKLREAKIACARAEANKKPSTAAGLKPDLAAMTAHIYELCHPAFTLAYPNAVLEIAYGHPAIRNGDVDQAHTYPALSDQDLPYAAEIAAERNAKGCNTYIGVALRSYGDRAIPPDRRATVEDYLASRFAWVDFDKAGDAERIDAVLKQHGLVPRLIVTTGTIPHLRGQLYFQVTGIRDTAHQKEINSALQRLLGSDPAVVVGHQVLRLAGSINHPTEKKKERGYVPELTTLRKIDNAPTYSADHVIGLAPPAEASSLLEQRQHYNGAANPFRVIDDYRLEADPDLIASALGFIPNNDLDWESWKKILLAAWRATNGDDRAFVAIDKWSSKSSKYDAKETLRQWRKIFKSPPTDIGAGSIFKIARDNGWKRSTRSEVRSQNIEAEHDEAAAPAAAAPAASTSSAAAAELAEACAELAALQGKSNAAKVLRDCAFAMGRLIAAGRMQEQHAISRLTEAAREAGVNEADVADIVAGGIAAGKLKPRLPTIKMIPGQIARAIDYAEAELLASGFPILQRGGLLVHPVKNELAAADDTKTEVVVLRALRKEPMVYVLNKQAAVFKKYNERKKQFMPIDPPPEVALGLLQKDQWKFSDVSGVTTTPTMRPDGALLDQPGYDPATQLLYVPDRHLAVPPIDPNPTRAEAMQALQRLDALLDGFPFVSDVDRAVALAGLMTPVLRGAFNVAPMTLLTAPTAGTGKSHYVNTASTIATGRVCPVITNVPSSEEMEKRLGAMVLEGVPIISLDNCTHDLGGDLLCQITEQRYVRIRILGKSEQPQCEYRGSVYATGNNVTFIGDMTRRGLICNLDAALERPETRSFAFDPVKRAAEQRGQYIHDILTVARAYRAAGCPKTGCGSIGSYGAWSATVREPLVWLGKADPIASMDTLREEDPARIAARRMVALQGELPSSFSAAELIQLAEKMEAKGSSYPQTYEYAHPELRELLIQQAGNFKGVIDSRKLSRWLSSIRGQIHDGFRLVLIRESKGHGNRYAIEAVERDNRRKDVPLPEAPARDPELAQIEDMIGKAYSAFNHAFSTRMTLDDLRRQRPGLEKDIDEARKAYWTARDGGDMSKIREAGERVRKAYDDAVAEMNETMFRRSVR